MGLISYSLAIVLAALMVMLAVAMVVVAIVVYTSCVFACVTWRTWRVPVEQRPTWRQMFAGAYSSDFLEKRLGADRWMTNLRRFAAAVAILAVAGGLVWLGLAIFDPPTETSNDGLTASVTAAYELAAHNPIGVTVDCGDLFSSDYDPVENGPSYPCKVSTDQGTGITVGYTIVTRRLPCWTATRNPAADDDLAGDPHHDPLIGGAPLHLRGCVTARKNAP